MLAWNIFCNSHEDHWCLATLKSGSVLCSQWSSAADKLHKRERCLAWECKGDKSVIAVKMPFLLKKKLGKGSYCQAESGGVRNGGWDWDLDMSTRSQRWHWWGGRNWEQNGLACTAEGTLAEQSLRLRGVRTWGREILRKLTLSQVGTCFDTVLKILIIILALMVFILDVFWLLHF